MNYQTQLLPATTVKEDPAALRKMLEPAAAVIQKGGLVAFPTETVYGLGASITFPSAIAEIFRIKGRPNDNPLIVHVPDVAAIEPLVKSFSPAARALAEAFMPGPLTLILPRSRTVPDCVTAGLDTVGVRVPESPITRTLARLAGLPMAGPSANLSGRPSPTNAAHVLHDLNGLIPYIIDGGPSRVGLESTVLDMSSTQPRVLRPGVITAEAILSVLDTGGFSFPGKYWREILLESGLELHKLEVGTVPRSPGMKYRHYAPDAPVTLIEGDSAAERLESSLDLLDELYKSKADFSAAIFAGEELVDAIREHLKFIHGSMVDVCEQNSGGQDKEDAYKDNKAPIIYTYSYGEEGDSVAAAQHLFDALRTLDSRNPDVIFASSLPEDRIGAAYMNRLRKAVSSTEEK